MGVMVAVTTSGGAGNDDRVGTCNCDCCCCCCLARREPRMGLPLSGVGEERGGVEEEEWGWEGGGGAAAAGAVEGAPLDAGGKVAEGGG